MLTLSTLEGVWVTCAGVPVAITLLALTTILDIVDSGEPITTGLAGQSLISGWTHALLDSHRFPKADRPFGSELQGRCVKRCLQLIRMILGPDHQPGNGSQDPHELILGDGSTNEIRTFALKGLGLNVEQRLRDVVPISLNQIHLDGCILQGLVTHLSTANQHP